MASSDRPLFSPKLRWPMLNRIVIKHFELFQTYFVSLKHKYRAIPVMILLELDRQDVREAEPCLDSLLKHKFMLHVRDEKGEMDSMTKLLVRGFDHATRHAKDCLIVYKDRIFVIPNMDDVDRGSIDWTSARKAISEVNNLALQASLYTFYVDDAAEEEYYRKNLHYSAIGRAIINLSELWMFDYAAMVRRTGQMSRERIHGGLTIFWLDEEDPDEFELELDTTEFLGYYLCEKVGSGPDIHLIAFHINPDHEGRGYAANLLQEIAHRFTSGVPAVTFTLEAPVDKVGFYVKQGFNTVGDPEPAVVGGDVQRMVCTIEMQALDIEGRARVAAAVLCPKARAIILG